MKNLQQQLRRSKKKIGNMADVINNLQDDLIIKSVIGDRLHSSFDTVQLSIFHNTKNNTTVAPTGRRYTDDIKEFPLTLYYYTPKAYQYVRSIIPLPNPSLIREWSSSVDCEPGFLNEALNSLEAEVKNSPTKDCSVIIDAMAIPKQTVVDPKGKEQYVGFVNDGLVTPEDPDTLAAETLVFLLVGRELIGSVQLAISSVIDACNNTSTTYHNDPCKGSRCRVTGLDNNSRRDIS